MYLRIHLETNENAAALFLAGDDGSFYNERQRGYNSFQPWKLSSLKQHNWCFGAHVGRGARVETCLPSSSQPSLLLPATRGRLKALGMSRAEPQRQGGAPEPQRLQTTFPRNAVVSRLRPESQHPSRAGSWVFNWVFPGRRAVRSETPGVSSGRGWSCTEYLFEWVLNANPSLAGGELGPLATISYSSRLWDVPRGKQGGMVDLRPWEAGGSWASTRSGCFTVKSEKAHFWKATLPEVLFEWVTEVSEKGSPIYTAC